MRIWRRFLCWIDGDYSYTAFPASRFRRQQFSMLRQTRMSLSCGLREVAVILVSGGAAAADASQSYVLHRHGIFDVVGAPTTHTNDSCDSLLHDSCPCQRPPTLTPSHMYLTTDRPANTHQAISIRCRRRAILRICPAPFPTRPPLAELRRQTGISSFDRDNLGEVKRPTVNAVQDAFLFGGEIFANRAF